MSEAKKAEGKPAKRKPYEVHVLSCERCETTNFLLADDQTILCAKCLGRVAARWYAKTEIN